MLALQTISEQPQRTPNVVPKRLKKFDFDCPYFALIYIDENGELGVQSSSSIENYSDAVFTKDVAERFKRTALSDRQQTRSLGTKRKLEDTNVLDHSTFNGNQFSEAVDASQLQGNANGHPDSRTALSVCEPQPPPSKQVKRNIRMRHLPLKQSLLPVGKQALLRKYYEKAFERFQQVNCKIVAKAFIKLVEPRKQVNFPYNGRKPKTNGSEPADPECTKPKWWPSGVTHREPDHLLKLERIRLLVHILCELHESHGITADKLREASQEVRRAIFPAEHLKVLDEIYHVRRMEEMYLDGELDGNALISVAQVPLSKASSSETEDDTRIDNAITVSSNAASTAVVPSTTTPWVSSHAPPHSASYSYKPFSQHLVNHVVEPGNGNLVMESPMSTAINTPMPGIAYPDLLSGQSLYAIPPSASPPQGSTQTFPPSAAAIRGGNCGGSFNSSLSSFLTDVVTPLMSPFSDAQIPPINSSCASGYFPPRVIFSPAPFS